MGDEIRIRVVRTGDMLRTLYDAESKLPALLREADQWNTLDVDYEPPRVERLWMQLGLFRLYLHRIHPCEKPLFHSHPWPSAVRIITGRYEMEVGFDHIPAATITLLGGSEYEMIEPNGFHSVRPIAIPSYSVMVTGQPWRVNNSTPSPTTKLNPLPAETKAEILSHFRQFYGSRA